VNEATQPYIIGCEQALVSGLSRLSTELAAQPRCSTAFPSGITR
jgi:hypothetical protein